MIARLKELIKRHWPRLRLRTILLIVLLVVAAMPIAGMVLLRVYENTLVRQTEVELVSQGAALSATAQALWPGAAPPVRSPDKDAPGYYRPESTGIDLSASPVLPSRPPATFTARPADPDALAVLPALGPIIDETTRTTLASVVVTDRHGRVVLGLGEGRSLAGLKEVKSALEGKPLTVMRRLSDYRKRYDFEWLSRASGIRLHHARPIVVNGRVEGVLLLSRSPRALFRGLYEDRGKFLLGLAGIIAILVVLSGLVSRGITRPIEALSRASRDVASGAGEVPDTPRTAAVEIRQLYEDFAVMAAAIARRSRYLRDFAAAVSHEFKTPLAGITGAVELLQDHGATMKPEDRQRFLGNIAADSGRLNQLVTRLLDLARHLFVEFGPTRHPASGVGHGELATEPIGIVGLAVAGDSRAVFDDRHLTTDEAVEEGALADVGSTDDHDMGFHSERSRIRRNEAPSVGTTVTFAPRSASVDPSRNLPSDKHTSGNKNSSISGCAAISRAMSAPTIKPATAVLPPKKSLRTGMTVTSLLSTSASMTGAAYSPVRIPTLPLVGAVRCVICTRTGRRPVSPAGLAGTRSAR